jgi:lecithin-cholesterol acyltransferase
MLFVLVLVSHSRKPVFVIPSLDSLSLSADFTAAGLPWYCPQDARDLAIWPLPEEPEPGKLNCFFKLLTISWNSSASSYSSQPNATIRASQSPPPLVRFLSEQGWSPDSNLFTFAYDWRLVPTGLDATAFRSQIEFAYRQNNETKLVLIGLGVGGLVTQSFLASSSVEWKRKYVDSAILVAPTFGGASFAFETLWTKRLPGFPHEQSPELLDMVESIPFFASHLPNFFVYNDTDLIRGPHNFSVLPADIPDFLTNHSKVAPHNLGIFRHAVAPLNQMLAAPDVPVFVVFNGAIETNFTWNFKHGWDKVPKIKAVDGDGVVPSRAIQWACLNWSIRRGSVECVDVYRDSPDFEHDRLASNPFVMNLVMNMALREDLDEKRERRIARLPYVVLNGSGYHLREDLRRESVLFHSEL